METSGHLDIEQLLEDAHLHALDQLELVIAHADRRTIAIERRTLYAHIVNDVRLVERKFGHLFTFFMIKN